MPMATPKACPKLRETIAYGPPAGIFPLVANADSDRHVGTVVETQSKMTTVDRAMPAYEAAIRALDNLDKKDVIEMKSFKTPPAAVQTVME